VNGNNRYGLRFPRPWGPASSLPPPSRRLCKDVCRFWSHELARATSTRSHPRSCATIWASQMDGSPGQRLHPCRIARAASLIFGVAGTAIPNTCAAVTGENAPLGPVSQPVNPSDFPHLLQPAASSHRIPLKPLGRSYDAWHRGPLLEPRSCSRPIPSCPVCRAFDGPYRAKITAPTPMAIIPWKKLRQRRGLFRFHKATSDPAYTELTEKGPGLFSCRNAEVPGDFTPTRRYTGDTVTLVGKPRT